MSVTSAILEPWLLVNLDVKIRTFKHVENDTENKKVIGWLEEADHFVVVQRRHFVGLRAFKDDAGKEGSSFSWYTGRGKLWTWFKSSTKGAPRWVCTNDRVEVTDHITGEGWETQVWELQSKFVPVPGSYYEEQVSTEAPS